MSRRSQSFRRPYVLIEDEPEIEILSYMPGGLVLTAEHLSDIQEFRQLKTDIKQVADKALQCYEKYRAMYCNIQRGRLAENRSILFMMHEAVQPFPSLEERQRLARIYEEPIPDHVGPRRDSIILPPEFKEEVARLQAGEPAQVAKLIKEIESYYFKLRPGGAWSKFIELAQEADDSDDSDDPGPNDSQVEGSRPSSARMSLASDPGENDGSEIDLTQDSP